MHDHLLIAREGGRTVLTLNRPAKLNALDEALVEALLVAFDQARDDGTSLLVMRGAGKGFSGGFDFGGLDALSDGDLALRFIRLEMLLQSVWTAPFVTLALAHGPCFGAAADIVAACTLRYATADAKFRMPGLRFGIALGTRRLAALVGHDRARSLLMTSRIFTASEALPMGFLSGIAEMADWEAITAEAARDAAVLSPASRERLLRLTRRDAPDADLAELVRSLAAPGLKERIAAYLEALQKR
ncbi:MAG: enoyl-CoA hydratase/isomerase family protein [Hyphomicrobiaceae bacterium]|nr:enoyl-CoA hydratase/isomerase family protein [Hyphomicrobiaceae bacterium]